MTPLSRFTLFHSSLPVDGLVVENPIGWDTAVISLERHKDYHSLFEYFKGTFLWFGTGMETLKAIEKAFGPNTTVRLTIDISFKAGVFVNVFTGKIDLWQIEEIIIADRQDYKMTAPIVQDDFVTRFEQLHNGMRTDVTGATGDEDSLYRECHVISMCFAAVAT